MKLWEVASKQERSEYGFKNHDNVLKVTYDRLAKLDDVYQDNTVTLQCYQTFGKKIVSVGTLDLAYPQEFEYGFLVSDYINRYCLVISLNFEWLAIMDFNGEIAYYGKSKYKFAKGYELKPFIKDIRKKFKKTIDNIK